MSDLSVGATLAWQIAANEARQARHPQIDGPHLLIGLCSLEKALHPDVVKARGLDDEAARVLNEDERAVADAFRGAGVDPRALRRALRKALGNRGADHTERMIHRSPACRQLFARAADLAGLSGLVVTGPLHLLAAIFEAPEEVVATVLRAQGWDAEALRARLAESLGSGTDVPADVTTSRPADSPVFSATETPTADTVRRLALLYELPLQLGREGPPDAMLQAIVQRLIDVIPGATRAALVARDRATGDLLLKAHCPMGQPSVSGSLSRRAMEERRGLVWRRGTEVTASQLAHGIESGMYAPLLWKGETLGFLCVDNRGNCPEFSDEDLRLMIAVAQHAAAALAHHELQADAKRNAALIARLLTNFSPRVRERLLARARQGRLRLDGGKSEVTILMSDIRGFTAMSSGMDAEDVVDLLNDYFSVFVDAIFRHEGTIDKFVGDAILAVFGSPDPDSRQHENAVRAALAMQSGAAAVSAARAARRLTTCEIGIGIHCGEVFHGFIGSDDRMEFTVIGDAVNRASRYCDGAEAGSVLISADLHQRVWNLPLRFEPVGIRTKHEGDFAAFRVTTGDDTA